MLWVMICIACNILFSTHGQLILLWFVTFSFLHTNGFKTFGLENVGWKVNLYYYKRKGQWPIQNWAATPLKPYEVRYICDLAFKCFVLPTFDTETTFISTENANLWENIPIRKALSFSFLYISAHDQSTYCPRILKTLWFNTCLFVQLFRGHLLVMKNISNKHTL